MKLKTEHLQRYKQIAALLWKYGRSDVVQQLGIEDTLALEERKPAALAGAPDQLADDLEAMGPTYVKLGQVLSGRPDLLPEPYIRALARLQDKVKPFPYEEVEEIVAGDLGVRISKAFAWFDPKPVAAASLGQVHRAALRDGWEVVVKVQRPNIAKQIADDFEVLQQIAEFLQAHTDVGKRHRLVEVLDQFRHVVQNELNYEREAQNLVSMARNLEEFELICVPNPVPDYCTRRVLTMDYIEGTKITKLSPVALVEMEGSLLAKELFHAYLKQVLVDGLFHADPHPGNVFITPDCRIALLDLGMVGRTTPVMQENLLKVLMAVSEAKSDVAADIIICTSETAEHFDSTLFARRIGQIILERHDQGLQQMDVGRTLLQVAHTAGQLGLYVPTDLTLLGKTLLQLEEVGRILDPHFDPNAAIRENITEIMSRRMRKTSSQASIFHGLLELKDFVSGLPLRLNKIMDAIAEREIEVRVKAIDADLMMEGLQKVANRITSGVILASLIIGASLLMRVETTFRILGYPGIAILCFLFAAAGGVWLLASIFIQDQKSNRKAAMRLH